MPACFRGRTTCRVVTITLMAMSIAGCKNKKDQEDAPPVRTLGGCDLPSGEIVPCPSVSDR